MHGVKDESTSTPGGFRIAMQYRVPYRAALFLPEQKRDLQNTSFPQVLRLSKSLYGKVNLHAKALRLFEGGALLLREIIYKV